MDDDDTHREGRTFPGFAYHHAKPDYVCLTRWLRTEVPSPLPTYAFTQIGVGGLVVNSKDEILMVKVSGAPRGALGGGRSSKRHPCL